jgi:hypothetical protein
MTASPRSVHALIIGRPSGGEHRASSLCPCDPVQCRDLEEPGRLVYVHRWTAEPPDRRAGPAATPALEGDTMP